MHYMKINILIERNDSDLREKDPEDKKFGT